MKKRIILLLAFILVFSMPIFAVGESEEGSTTEEVTLRSNTWVNPATIEAVEELNRLFMEKYPHIKVEFTSSPTDQFQQENPMRIQANDVDIWSGFGFAQKTQSFHQGVEPAEAYQNIEAGFVDNDFIVYFINSILYSLVANSITLSISALAAFVISRKYIKFSNFFYILFLIGIFLPDPLIPQFILIRSMNLYNNPIGYIFLKTNPGIIMLLMVGYYKTIPKEFDEATAIEGCGILRFLWQFLLPMSKPIFTTSAILFTIGIWNDIIGSTIFLTSPKYYPIVRGLFSFVGQYGTNWPPLAAAVFLVALPIIIIYIFFQKHIISSIATSGIKG